MGTGTQGWVVSGGHRARQQRLGRGAETGDELVNPNFKSAVYTLVPANNSLRQHVRARDVKLFNHTIELTPCVFDFCALHLKFNGLVSNELTSTHSATKCI